MTHHITPSYLTECIEYNSDTGSLTWRERPSSHFSDGSKSAQHLASIWNAKFKMKPAFTTIGNHGYYTSSISGKRLSAHRVCWAIYHGEWPKGEIDHINGDKLDNSIANLRDVTRSQNARNLSVKSGRRRGVYWYAPTSRWVAKITVNRKMYHLGYFKVEADAVSARRLAEEINGFHKNHGRAG